MIDSSLRDWLDAHADPLDRGDANADLIVPRLAAAGVFGIGVGVRDGGAGGATADAIAAIAAVAEHSLTAAFVCWGQRAFIEYLLHSPNAALREGLLGPLLRGELAGATGLSNAIKFLSGLESLQVRAHDEPSGFSLSGKLPWVTNLRKTGFVVACAVDHGKARAPSIFAVPYDAPGVTRSDDLGLVAMRASDTAAIALDAVALDRRHLLHPDATTFLRLVRPSFLSFQCGLALGLARAALCEARALTGSGRSVLGPEIEREERARDEHARVLSSGLTSGQFERTPARLFECRLALVELALRAVGLELEARGGRAYLETSCGGFARRWREASFLPIVTPSSVQLRAELARHEVRESA